MHEKQGSSFIYFYSTHFWKVSICPGIHDLCCLSSSLSLEEVPATHLSPSVVDQFHRPSSFILNPHKYPSICVACGQLLVWLIPPYQHNLENNQDDICHREWNSGPGLHLRRDQTSELSRMRGQRKRLGSMRGFVEGTGHSPHMMVIGNQTHTKASWETADTWANDQVQHENSSWCKTRGPEANCTPSCLSQAQGSFTWQYCMTGKGPPHTHLCPKHTLMQKPSHLSKLYHGHTWF